MPTLYKPRDASAVSDPYAIYINTPLSSLNTLYTIHWTYIDNTPTSTLTAVRTVPQHRSVLTTTGWVTLRSSFRCPSPEFLLLRPHW